MPAVFVQAEVPPEAMVTAPSEARVKRVARVLAVEEEPAAGAVLKIKDPEPPVPVPFEASKVKLAPAMSVPEAAAPLIVVAVGVPPSPAPKIEVLWATIPPKLTSSSLTLSPKIWDNDLGVGLDQCRFGSLKSDCAGATPVRSTFPRGVLTKDAFSVILVFERSEVAALVCNSVKEPSERPVFCWDKYSK